MLDWLDELPDEPQERVYRQLHLLARQGHHARRPLVENLGEGIYELRAQVGRVNYRILFSFYGRNAVLLTCGFTKEREIPDDHLRRARQRLQEFQEDPRGDGRMSTSNKASDALEIMRRRYFSEPDPERDARMHAYDLALSVAQAVYDLRAATGLDQSAFAARVGLRWIR